MKGTSEEETDYRVLVERIAPIMRGQRPDLVCAALADLLAMVIAGHRAQTREETEELHRRLLANVCGLIGELIPPYIQRADDLIAQGLITSKDVRRFRE
jgi:hypothetical protein